MKVTTLSNWLLTADAAPSHSGLWTPRTALSGFPRENPVKLLPLPVFMCFFTRKDTVSMGGVYASLLPVEII